jgi:hypothetical protein
MQAQPNNTRKAGASQATEPWGRGELRQSPAETNKRYLVQINRMLVTARRWNKPGVIVALTNLLHKRGG